MDIGANPLLLLISLGQAIKLHLINEPTILELYINAMCFFCLTYSCQNEIAIELTIEKLSLTFLSCLRNILSVLLNQRPSSRHAIFLTGE